MTLGTNLAADIQAVFDSAPASAHIAAVAMAQAYWDYVESASFGPDLPVLLETARDLMAATLEASLNPVTGTAVTAAAAWAAGVAAFWQSPVVPCLPVPGKVNGCPGATSITASMAAVFLNLANTSAIAAAGMDASIETATLTTFATLNVPPPTPFFIA